MSMLHSLLQYLVCKQKTVDYVLLDKLLEYDDLQLLTCLKFQIIDFQTSQTCILIQNKEIYAIKFPRVLAEEFLDRFILRVCCTWKLSCIKYMHKNA